MERYITALCRTCPWRAGGTRDEAEDVCLAALHHRRSVCHYVMILLPDWTDE